MRFILGMEMQKTAGKLILEYILRYRMRWLLGLGAVILSVSFSMVVPWVLRQAVDSLNTGVDIGKLVRYAVIIVLSTLIQGVFLFFMRQTMIVASRKIEYDLRRDYFDKILTLDRPYFDKTPTGDIMARATNDLEAVRNMIGPGIMYFTNTVFTFTLALAMMLVINPILTLISISPLPLISISTYFLGRKVHRHYSRIQEQYSALTTEVQEYLSGIRVIKAYVQEDNAWRRFAGINGEFIKRNLDMIRVWGLFFPIIFGLAGVSIALVLWIGGGQVIKGTSTLGDLVAFASYLMILLWPMAALGWVAGLYQRGMASMKRIAEVFNSRPLIFPPTCAITHAIRGDIEFRNLHFAYNGKPVLSGINMKIPARSRVALVGRTGSGKSTLISLIPKLYPVEDGMLFIDGVDINRYDPAALRSQIGLVSQEPFLFSTSIKNNIGFGAKSDAADPVKFAVTASIAEDINAFENGYETLIGERGITLSGGQKQRLALARALAINPKIVILDDAFSSVDTSTEENILNKFADALADCTVIMISHRISTVKNCDMIYVLDQGKIIEGGVHDELLAKGGLYSMLHERQLIEQELETI